MERIIDIEAPYDKTNPDPSKNYGIHGGDIRMVLKGPLGAVQFLVFPQRQMPHVHERFLMLHPQISSNHPIRKYVGTFPEPGKELQSVFEYYQHLVELHLHNDCILCPMGADVGFHSPTARYSGQEPMRHVYKPMEFKPGKFGEEPEFTPAVYGETVICPYIDGDKPCYYDGSSLAGRDLGIKFLESGNEEVIWHALQRFYVRTFGQTPVEKTND